MNVLFKLDEILTKVTNDYMPDIYSALKNTYAVTQNTNIMWQMTNAQRFDLQEIYVLTCDISLNKRCI